MALPRALANTLFRRQLACLSGQCEANSATAVLGSNPFFRRFASDAGEESITVEVSQRPLL